MKRVFIIAEAGVNHNGDIKLAYKLIDAAKDAGVDAVKFQTFQTDKIVSQFAPMAQYQVDNCSENNSQFQMLKKLELSYDEFVHIKEYCNSKNIEFMSTPDEEDSLDFLVGTLHVEKIKVGSGEIDNLPYLRKIGRTRRDVILSTGMSTLEEVGRAVSVLEENGARSISLLHCNTDYPTQMKDANLRAIVSLKTAFGREVGYSDHTLGFDAAVAAVALGASIVEKHFTIDKNLPGPDHKASLDSEELKELVSRIREIEIALGSGIKVPTESESRNIEVVRKSIVAKCDISMGQVFTDDNITTKRAGKGLSPMLWDDVIGRKAVKDFRKDELIII